MDLRFVDIAATPAGKAVQPQRSVAHLWKSFQVKREFDRLMRDAARSIAERDSFYMTAIPENGWLNVQHRGGPFGFLGLLGERPLSSTERVLEDAKGKPE